MGHTKSSNKTRTAALEKIKRTLKGLSYQGDYHAVIQSAIDYEESFLAMPSTCELLSIASEALSLKITSLSNKRNTFVAACRQVNSSDTMEKTFLTYATEINIRMPMLTSDICDRFVALHTDDCADALKVSPFSKPEAPTLSGPIQAIPYSRGESAKSHLSSKKARAALDKITHIDTFEWVSPIRLEWVIWCLKLYSS